VVFEGKKACQEAGKNKEKINKIHHGQSGRTVAVSKIDKSTYFM
jgi:hypothetical protein